MPASRSRRARRRYAWETLADEQLLSLRFCDLKLTIEGTDLDGAIKRLYGELATRGIRFRPHCWLSQEWFSPDGIPGIAIPFYLAHPRLTSIERRHMREVEGGNRNWLMRILRHEAGHAIDSAYRLRRRRYWREVFGPASLPYPDTYRPRPGSSLFVQHLGGQVTVAFAEQNPAKRHTLPRRAQTDFAQHGLHVMPGATGEVAARRLGSSLGLRHYHGMRQRHLAPKTPNTRVRQNRFICNIYTRPAPRCNSFATTLLCQFVTALGDNNARD